VEERNRREGKILGLTTKTYNRVRLARSKCYSPRALSYYRIGCSANIKVLALYQMGVGPPGFEPGIFAASSNIKLCEGDVLAS
jgi:hypothetical protein